ncbi:MAG: hypothetical protein N3D14_00120 [Aquificaceae bacterium]|nr:hypothetical protein [Aquificaceae bacterium]
MCGILLRPELFLTEEKCVINPGLFHVITVAIEDQQKTIDLQVSIAPDLLIGDLLSDIEVAETIQRQAAIMDIFLLCYVFAGREEPEISRIGIYFARHGHLGVFNVRELMDESQLVKVFTSARQKCLENFYLRFSYFLLSVT